MDLYFRIDINLAAIVLLGFIIFLSYRRLDRKTKINRMFILTVYVVLLQLIFESLTCVMNKQPGEAMFVLSNIFHVFLFLTAPTLTFIWLILIKNVVIPYEKITKPWIFVLAAPLIVNTIIVLLSPFLGLVFSIEAGNIYQRGPLFYLASAITYYYMVLAIIGILVNRKKILKNEFSLFIVIALLPIIGGIVQSVAYGVLLMWSSAAFALVIGYIFLQQRIVHLDALTGCWSRESLLYFLSVMMRVKDKNCFGAIYFDINKLKDINDKYGHLEGDRAIRRVAGIVKKELRMTDIFARMGGDEFVVLLDSEEDSYLAQVLERIKGRFAEYNANRSHEYILDCSFGADIYTGAFESEEHFLNHIDALMYQNKQK